MTATSDVRAIEPSRYQRLRGDPLARTAGALVLNSGLTSVLGVAYWVVVARLYDPTDLANNAALISTMLTICGICQMNLGLSMGALLPRAGRHSGRLLVDMYLATIVASLIVVVAFAVVVAPHLDYVDSVLGGAPAFVLFGLAVVSYNFFALQDSALSSLGAPGVVPLENAAFGMGKIVLVVVLASLSGGAGIFLSWTVPAGLLVIPVSLYLARRLVPSHTSAPSGPSRLRSALRPVAGDYLGYLLLICSTLALPAIAVSLVGAKRSAAFSVPWMLSSSLDTVASNIGIALTIEGAKRRTSASRLRSSAITRAVPLVAALAAVLMLLTPIVLRLYGGVYARDGVGVLRLLLLAAPLRAIAVLTMGEARAQGRIRFIIGLQALSSVLVIGGAFLLTDRLGIQGIAVAWLIAQLAAGSISLIATRRRARLMGRPTGTVHSVPT